MTLQTNVKGVTSDASSPAIGAMLWRLAPMIYGPTVLFALGEGAIVPLLPVIATNLGADVPTAAIVVSALVVGQLCGNLPAGWAVGRIGERWTMVIGGLAAALAGIGIAVAPNLWVFTAAVFIIGMSAAAFGLARHSFMTTRVPLSFRARALSLLGGTFRLGMFVGPFVAAGLLSLFGNEQTILWFFLGFVLASVALVLFGPDPERAADDAPVDGAADEIAEAESSDTGEVITGPIRTPGEPHPATGVLRTMWRNRRVLSRLGVAAASLSAVRSARQVALPLWGVSLGLDAQTIALVVGISGAIDFALFYASGQVMDRFGRLWAALPAMLLMGGGFLLLSVTHDSTQHAMWFGLCAAVLGVGNGLSSGILLTLGADTAPESDPAAYLGSWRTLTDAGGAVAPLLLSAVTAIASLSWAVGTMGVIALLGAGAFARWVPRFVPRAAPRR